MKTEAIRECLNVTATIGPVTHTRVSEARAELAAIREENAGLIEACCDARLSLGQSFESTEKRDLLAIIGEAERIIEAALSGKPSGEGAVQPEPCKKCGAESLSLMLSAPPGMKYPFSQVGCALCGAKGPIGKNDSTAIARWNALSGEPSGKVPSIRGPVLWFAGQMERRLAAHDEERGKRGWDDAHGGEWEWLLGRLLEEVQELRATYTYDSLDPEYDSIPAIINEAADAANFAMMLADRAKSHTTVEEKPYE